MTGAILRIVGLTGIYLAVLTSLDPGDIAVGVVLATGLVVAGRATGPQRTGAEWLRWTRAVLTMLWRTGVDIVIGSVRVARFCLVGGGSPGFVEIPRGDRSRHRVALWGVLTGEAPDEYPVVVDDARHVLVVHRIDAHDPDAVRARHQAADDTFLEEVVR